jgi:hypothetical protein
MLQRPPSQRDRHARYRQRVTRGECCVSITINVATVNMRVETKWLDAKPDVYSRAEIASAIERMLAIPQLGTTVNTFPRERILIS